MELRCKETVDFLLERGHEIVVLTSKYGKPEKIKEEKNIYRQLYLESDIYYYQTLRFFLHKRRNDRQNVFFLNKLLEEFIPDVVFVWGMWNLSRQLPFFLENFCSIPVAYSIADTWPITPNIHDLYWVRPTQRKISRPAKRILKFFANRLLKVERNSTNLKFKSSICVSNFLKNCLSQSNEAFKNSVVIYPGVNTSRFKQEREKKVENNKISLIYAGSLVPHKGVHTAVEAVDYIVNSNTGVDINLTIVGSGHPQYENFLHEEVKQRGLSKAVTFMQRIPREQIPILLETHDILLLTSQYEEPFSRTVLEGMATGLVVIGTPTGGTKEILVENENGLTFPPGDSVRLAKQVIRVVNDTDLYFKISTNASKIITKEFDTNRMGKEFENYLLKLTMPKY
jgi:glycosyltransferase involved in cell wall biosynthesis